ncbi:SUMO-activating enzyme subunit 1-like [Clavelina lepadiformis]|uniref:SUMO-activating enzyme subunit 1-like n=1 Tax=Clavelina lepadiformis TaxID=159417 RepID=UPI0040434C58
MTSDAISKEELDQYDRQIRLWGIDAQKRLRKANVLIIGLGGLGSEVVKNIVLTGVNSITLLDWRNVVQEDLNSQLLITPDCVDQNVAESSRNRAQELNPNVQICVDSGHVTRKDEKFFQKFDVICLTLSDEKLRLKMNTICRSKNIKFFSGDVFGFFGYFFTDLGNIYEYVVEVPAKKTDHEPEKAKVDKTVTVKRVTEFCTYADAMEEDWTKRSRKSLKNSSSVFFIIQIYDEFKRNFNRPPQDGDKDALLEIKRKVLSRNGMKESFLSDDFVDFCRSALSPVCAIVGGVLGQEMIKAISGKDQPHNNFFFYDGLKHLGVVDKISP